MCDRIIKPALLLIILEFIGTAHAAQVPNNPAPNNPAPNTGAFAAIRPGVGGQGMGAQPNVPVKPNVGTETGEKIPPNPQVKPGAGAGAGAGAAGASAGAGTVTSQAKGQKDPQNLYKLLKEQQQIFASEGEIDKKKAEVEQKKAEVSEKIIKVLEETTQGQESSTASGKGKSVAPILTPAEPTTWNDVINLSKQYFLKTGQKKPETVKMESGKGFEFQEAMNALGALFFPSKTAPLPNVSYLTFPVIKKQFGADVDNGWKKILEKTPENYLGWAIRSLKLKQVKLKPKTATQKTK